jgi:ubiquinone/menaquinone biosynthesis C-methylase UbiE
MQNLVAKYYDSLSKIYDSESERGMWTPNLELNKLLIPYLQKEDSVLDIGVGTGQTIQKLFEMGCKVTGIDISGEMLEVAKSKFPNVEFYCVDAATDLSILNGKIFEAITAIGVFEFVERMDQVLNSLASFLKPNGLICFTYEEYLPDSELQKWEVSALGQGIVDPVPEPVSFLVYRRTPDEIGNLLARLGMTILEHYQFVSYTKTKRKVPIYYRIVLAKK